MLLEQLRNLQRIEDILKDREGVSQAAPAAMNARAWRPSSQGCVPNTRKRSVLPWSPGLRSAVLVSCGC